MRKLLIILLLLNAGLQAQNLGFNGAGFFENYNADVAKWLNDWGQPFTIRVPGGAISKFHDPYNNRKGWGMSDENIRTWFSKDGFDEDGQGLDKWLGKADAQPDHSYMDDLIKLQKEFPEMKVIYVLNVLNSNTEANMNALRYMIKGGVNIVGAEAGNEVYGKYSSFEAYAQDFEPLFKSIRKEFPKIELAVCAAPMKNIKERDEWNRQMSAYKGDYDAAIMHIYYVQKDIPEAYNKMPDKVVTDENKENMQLSDAFHLAAEALMQNKLFLNHLDQAERLFPGKKLWITEWNTKPSDVFNNTILNGAWQFETMVAFRSRIEYLCLHNGVSPDKFGMISRSNKLDSEKTPLVKRVGYWAYQLAAEAGNAKELQWDKSYKLQSTSGNTTYYFTNMKDAYKPSIDYGNTEASSATIHYVSGKYIYSSAGWAGYMGKGTKPGYEVKGIKVEKFSGTIPANSFGYVVFGNSK